MTEDEIKENYSHIIDDLAKNKTKARIQFRIPIEAIKLKHKDPNITTREATLHSVRYDPGVEVISLVFDCRETLFVGMGAEIPKGQEIPLGNWFMKEDDSWKIEIDWDLAR